MVHISHVKAAIASAALSLFAAGTAQAAAYISTGNLSMALTYYDSGTISYTRSCGGATYAAGAADCDLAAGQTAGSTPGSAVGSVGGAYTDTQGIFEITSVTNTSTGFSIFDNSVDNYRLTGIFAGLTDIKVDVTGTVFNTRSQGGAIKVFKNAKGTGGNQITNLAVGGPTTAGGINLNSFLYTRGSGNGSSSNGTISGGTLWLDADFSESVIVAGDAPSSTFQSSFDTSNSTTGASAGFLNLKNGPLEGNNLVVPMALQDTLGNKHDLYFSNSFNLKNPATSFGWNVAGNTGQVVGNDAPEPSSLALVALTLLGLGAVTRRIKA